MLPSGPPPVAVNATSAQSGLTGVGTTLPLVSGSGHPTSGWGVFEGLNSLPVVQVTVIGGVLGIVHGAGFAPQDRVVYDGSDPTLRTAAGAILPAFDLPIPYP